MLSLDIIKGDSEGKGYPRNTLGTKAMNSWQMLCFDTVFKTLNFSEAAKELYISQQALSKQIQSLETLLGVKLFIRRPKVAPTREGEIVYDAVKEMLDAERRMNVRLTSVSKVRESVKVGLGYTRNRYLLTTFYPWFRSDYPEIELQITLDKAKNLQKRLLNGNISFWIGYLAEQNDKLEYEDLFEDPLIFCVPKNLLPAEWDYSKNPFSCGGAESREFGLDPGQLPIMLLPNGHTVRITAENYVQSFGITPNIILENNDNETLLRLGMDGVGALFVPRSVLEWHEDDPKMKNLLQFPVEYSPISQIVSIIRRKDEPLSEAQQIFLQACIKRLGNADV